MFSRLTARLKNYRSVSQGVAALREMDDRMLADIGVVRGDISRAVRIGRL